MFSTDRMTAKLLTKVSYFQMNIITSESRAIFQTEGRERGRGRGVPDIRGGFLCMDIKGRRCKHSWFIQQTCTISISILF